MICIQICSNREWRSVKELLFVQPNQITNYPFGEQFKIIIGDHDCTFYHSGATKTRSAAACQYAICNWQPTIVIVMGSCGGVAPNLRPLDVIIASRTEQYDCTDRMSGQLDKNFFSNPKSMFYEKFTTDIDNSWINLGELSSDVCFGIVATADQDINFEILTSLQNEQIACADWESGAIAPVCKLNKVQCCIVRGITDIPITNSVESAQNQGHDYRINTPKVMQKIIEKVLPVLLKSLKYNV